MNRRHPSEADLALLAGGECGRLTRFRLNHHLAGCPDCRDVLASFGELRAAVQQSAVTNLAPGEKDWGRIAAEMRANIRVGLAAGECVREVRSRHSQAWKPQLAIGMAGILLLAGAGVFLRGLLPRGSAPGVARAAVLQSSGAGVEVRTDSGGSMTLLNTSANQGDTAIDQTVTSQGAIRARYVDGNTGTVTITSVYVE